MSLDWLTRTCWILGLPGQNWMLVASSGLLIYGIALYILGLRKARSSIR